MISRTRMGHLARKADTKLAPIRSTLRRLQMTVSHLVTAVENQDLEKVRYYGLEVGDDAKHLIKGVREIPPGSKD